MCLLLLALNRVPGRPWLLLGNRDEFHARPSAPAQHWNESPDIVGGRDLVAAGSWLAVNRNGRYAAVTNVRSGSAPQPAPRSRGALVGEFVAGAMPAHDYLAMVAARRDEYGPFNLLVGDAATAGFVSSIDGKPRLLEDGIYAFSNGRQDDEWPKMRRLRTQFVAALIELRDIADRPDAADERHDIGLLDLLLDDDQPDDRDLPETGVGMDIERRLAPIFIRGEVYGTRCSTVAYARADGSLVLRERRFGPNAQALGETYLEV